MPKVKSKPFNSCFLEIIYIYRSQFAAYDRFSINSRRPTTVFLGDQVCTIPHLVTYKKAPKKDNDNVLVVTIPVLDITVLDVPGWDQVCCNQTTIPHVITA